jgi:drug/metabolite transporter (DMT)-like permease
VRVLIAAYTLLAIAAGARAAVQLATHAGDAPVPYALSAVAAIVYLTLAVALRRRGRWRQVAIVAATAELVGVLCVGTAEQLSATAWPDETVWSGFGAGYGWAPLVLPVAALVVLARSRAQPAREA